MRKEDVLKLPSMPVAGPSYPAGPYRFVNREYMIITYETDAQAIRAQLPEPLEPLEEPLVHYEWIKMPDSSGFGSYTESGLVIPCRFKGEEVNFVSQMYLDDDPPIVGGARDLGLSQEIRSSQARDRQGHADRHARIWRAARGDGHDGLQARGMAGNGERTRATLSKTQVNLKLIPGVDGSPGDLPARRLSISPRST